MPVDQIIPFQQEWSKGSHSLNFNFFERGQSKNQDFLTWNNFAYLQSIMTENRSKQHWVKHI